MARRAGSAGHVARAGSMEYTGRITRARSKTPQIDDRPIIATARSHKPRAKQRDHMLPEKEVLETLDEDVQSISPPLDDQPSSPALADHSIYSGTTAKTAFSQNEISDIDPEVALDSLEELAKVTESIATLLLPPDQSQTAIVREEIRDEDSVISRKLRKRVATFKLHHSDLANTQYIRPITFLRGLLGVSNADEVPSGPWRPDSIIRRINLVEMLRTLLGIDDDDYGPDADAFAALEALAANFATMIAGPRFDHTAFRFYIELLTQLCIFRMAIHLPEPGYNAHDIIYNTFYGESDPEFPILQSGAALHVFDLSRMERKRCEGAVNDVVSTLRAHVDTHPGDPRNAIALSKQRYPWLGLETLALSYYRLRKAELDEEIEAFGGVDTIEAALREEVGRVQSRRAALERRRSLVAFPAKATGALKGLKALKAREERLRGAWTALAAASPPQSTENASGRPPPATAIDISRTQKGPEDSSHQYDMMADPDAASTPTSSSASQYHVAEIENVSVYDNDYIRPDEHEEEEGAGSDDEVVNHASPRYPAPKVPQSPTPSAATAGVNQTDGEAADSSPANGTGESPRRSAIEALGKFQAQQRKTSALMRQRNYIDRQEGAVKVSFDDSQPSQMPERRGDANPSEEGSADDDAIAIAIASSSGGSSRAKRREGDEPEDFEPSQDTGFQVDRRDTSAADKRRRTIAQSSRVTIERSSRQDSSSSSIRPVEIIPVRSPPRQPLRPRRNPGSSIPPPVAPLDPDENVASEVGTMEQYDRVKHFARIDRIMVGHKRPRARRPWTRDETEALIDAIGECENGFVSWQLIKAKDNERGADARLADRTAEDLRFKARNVKYEYLRARHMQLPRNFDEIKLDKKFIDRLTDAGIDYHQETVRARFVA